MAAAAIVGAWVVFFAWQLLSDGVPYYRDHLVTNIPLRAYMRERLLAGALPQWFPYEGLGVPLIGQIAVGVFHPFNILFLPFEAAAGEKWALLSCYLVALAGAYRLARIVGASRPGAVTGAIAYGLGGYALGMSSIIAYVMSLASLPWVGWAALRAGRERRAKDAAVLGAVWATVFLAGDAIGFLFAGVFVILALIEPGAPRWRRCAPLLGGALIAALLVGVELLPATVVAAESVRNVGAAAPTLGTHWALHPLRVPELLAAGWVPDGIRYVVVGELLGGGQNLFVTTIYCGVAVVVLAALGVRRRVLPVALLAIGLLGLWLALGDRGGLLAIAREVLPLLRRFRYPERYLVWTFLAFAPLVALGYDTAVAATGRTARVFLAAAVPLVALAGLAWTGVLPRALWRLAGRDTIGPDVAAQVSAAWAVGFAVSAAVALLAALILLGGRSRPAALPLLALLVFADQLQGNGAHLPLVDPALIAPPNPFAAVVRAARAPGEPAPRVGQALEPFFPSTVTGGEGPTWAVGMSHFLVSDLSVLHGVRSLDQNLGALQARQALVLGSLQQKLQWGPLFNTCFWVAHERQPQFAPSPPVAVVPELALALHARPCRPRAYLAGAIPAEDRTAALRVVEAFRLDSPTIVWEGGPALPPARGTVRFVADDPERVVLEVHTESEAALTLSDDYMPGWTATVDGSAATIYPALVTARAVRVGPGEHRVEFRYRTPRLAIGAAASATGALLALLAWALSNHLARWARARGNRPGQVPMHP